MRLQLQSFSFTKGQATVSPVYGTNPWHTLRAIVKNEGLRGPFKVTPRLVRLYACKALTPCVPPDFCATVDEVLHPKSAASCGACCIPFTHS